MYSCAQNERTQEKICSNVGGFTIYLARAAKISIVFINFHRLTFITKTLT